jgi:hypothetical protein
MSPIHLCRRTGNWLARNRIYLLAKDFYLKRSTYLPKFKRRRGIYDRD